MSSSPWPSRPLLFAVLGGLSGLAIYFLSDALHTTTPYFAVRVSSALAIAACSLIFAMVAQRDRWLSSVVFSVLLAIVVGGIGYSTIVYDWPYLFSKFSFIALGVAVFIFTPFYQTKLHSRWNDYKALHDHAWSNTVAAPLGLLFVGLTFAIAYLLAELFSQVEIDFFRKLLRWDITSWLLGGISLGASLGVLREHESIVASTQRLVQSIFALLTLPLAIGLSGFLLVLPFTGLESLWNGTSATSATLFACTFASMVFVNSVVRENTESQSDNRLLQWAARLLAVCLAPLAIISALAIKLRVDQYGWTPDRIWAALICALLVMYGLLYLFSVIRWHRFNEVLRRANLAMAIMICAVALLLATPVLDFGAFSTNDQMMRLQDGRVTKDKLDLTALGFDFGPAGRDALATLKVTADTEFSSQIDNVLSAKTRRSSSSDLQRLPEDMRKQITVLNDGPEELPADLLRALTNSWVCGKQNANYCYLLWTADNREAFVLSQFCRPTGGCQPNVTLFRQNNDHWTTAIANDDSMMLRDFLDKSGKSLSQEEFLEYLDGAAQQGSVELKPVQRVQIFIDGQPYGPTTRQR